MKCKYCFIAIFLLLSNSYKCFSQAVIIEGKVKGIPANKVYLVDAYRFKTKLDSSEYKNGLFKFTLKKNTEPFLASIVFYVDNNKARKLMFQIVKNGIPSKNGTDAFMTDKEHSTVIVGDQQNYMEFFAAPKMTIEGGQQNKYFLDHHGEPLGSLKDTEGKDRVEKLNNIKEQILQGANSYYLLAKINEHKFDYSVNELMSLMSLFAPEIRSSKLAHQIIKSTASRPVNGKIPQDLTLSDIFGRKQQAINKHSKLNMLIFWASWCAPCISEIPQLKKLHASIKTSNFYMAGISIDSDKGSWIKSVKQNTMPWDQFLVPSASLEFVQSKYEFIAIPLIVFTDNSGKELIRFQGFNTENYLKYQNFIEEQLSKN